MANYVIGDIQGCFDEYSQLLNKIKFNSKKDFVWLTGDLINRGPSSLSVLKHVFLNRSSIKIVLGNHDLHFLAVYHGVRKLNKFDTLNDLLNSQDIDILARWLTKQPLVRNIRVGKKEFIMVHAGFPKSASKKLLIEVSREIKKALKKNPKKTLKMIFARKSNNKKLLKDKKSLKDWVDWLTRVRAVDENEVMDLNFKGKKSELKHKFKAWFSYDLKIMKKHRSIIFGHWAALEGKTNIERIHALDTGCVWNKKLTAMRLEDGRKFSVNKIN